MSLIILADEKYSAKLINTKALNVIYFVFGENYSDDRPHQKIMESIGQLVARVISHYGLHAIVDTQFYINLVDQKYKDSQLLKIEDMTGYTKNFNELVKKALLVENPEYNDYIHLQK